jgi:exonuclease VII small subunit
MKTKTFDCIRMKRQGAERVMKQLEGKSLQEQLEYWQKGTEDLKKHQQELKEARK